MATDTNTRISREHTAGVADIAEEGVEPPNQPRLAGVFSRQGDVAHVEPRARRRFIRIGAGAAVVRFDHARVEVELLGEVALETACADGKGELAPEPMPHEGVTRFAARRRWRR
jgi:hypothetical protein